jgi:hypothetical protein
MLQVNYNFETGELELELAALWVVIRNGECSFPNEGNDDSTVGLQIGHEKHVASRCAQSLSVLRHCRGTHSSMGILVTGIHSSTERDERVSSEFLCKTLVGRRVS